MFGTDDLKSLHLLDPEIRPLLDAIPSFKLSSETLAEFRSMEFPAPSPTEAELTVELLHRHVDGAPGSPPVRLAIYRPFGTSAPLPTILHIHGGGVRGREHRRISAALPPAGFCPWLCARGSRLPARTGNMLSWQRRRLLCGAGMVVARRRRVRHCRESHCADGGKRRRRFGGGASVARPGPWRISAHISASG